MIADDFVARSLGFHVYGMLPCYPSQRDGRSAKVGGYHRWMSETPPVDKQQIRRFRSFVRKWIRRNLVPLDVDTDLSVDSWLAETHYTEARKEELRKAKVDVLLEKHFRVSSFIKKEAYPSYKPPRWINSRSDPFKVYSGPFFHRVEKVLFSGSLSKYFVKGKAYDERARDIRARLYAPGATYFATDYSAFETSFSPELMKACELQLYSYMAMRLPGGNDLVRTITKALASRQTCVMRKPGIVAKAHARMSGDMCTSLGNGFTNLMIALFAAQELGWEHELCGIVEGDDGIFRADGPIPTKEWYAKLGFYIKLDEYHDLGEAGFCQTYFAESEEEPENVIDPLKFMAKLSWTTAEGMHGGAKVMMELAKAKGLSLLFMCPSGPILTAMALWVLRATSHVEPRWGSDWWTWSCLKSSSIVQCLEKSKLPIPYVRREFVERKWGVSVQHQLYIENYFNSLPNELRVIDDPIIMHLCSEANPHWVQNWHSHCVDRPRGSRW